MPMNKHSSIQRREIISRVIREAVIHSQEELLAQLRRKGVRIAQATLSRDLAELGVLKTGAGYMLPGDLPHDSLEAQLTPQERRAERLAQAVREFVLDVIVAGTLVVVRTGVAAAQPVARAVDEADIPELAGTIGGDDTIFLATRSAEDAARLARRLRALTGSPRESRRPRA